MKLEFTLYQCLAQLQFELAPLHHAHVHIAFEKAMCAASGRLGTIERHVGIPDQFIRIDAIMGCQCNADAGVDHDLMIGEDARRTNSIPNSRRHFGCVGRLSDERLDNNKFVTTQTSDHIGSPDTFAQPLSHRLEQLVADRMAKRIIDPFEIVEINEQDGKLLASLRRQQRLIKLRLEQGAIGKICQHVVIC